VIITGNKPAQESKRTRFRWPRNAYEYVKHAKAHNLCSEAVVAHLRGVYGRPRKACKEFAQRIGGFVFRGNRCWTDEEVDEIRRLLDKFTVAEIAKKLGVTPSAIYAVLRHRRILCAGPDEYSVRALQKSLGMTTKGMQSWLRKRSVTLHSRQAGSGTVEVVRSEDLVKALEANAFELLFHTNSARPATKRYEFMFLLVAPTKVPDDRTAQTHHREELEILESASLTDDFWTQPDMDGQAEAEGECA
jgi:hypothetical protein